MEGEKGLKPINTRPDSPVTKVEEEEEPLSPGARIFHAPQFNCFIIGVVGCKTEVNVEVIKDGLMHTLVNHPRFSSKLVLNATQGGEPTGWIRTKVNIDDHIIIPNIDPNTDLPDDFLENYLSNITTSPMDLTKPLWEFHILKIKTKDANSIGVFRIHHSIGDGISLMSLVLACTRQIANPDALPTLPSNTKKRNESSCSLGCFLGLWLFILKLVWFTLVDLVMFMCTALWLKDTDTPLKGGSGVGTSPKRFVYRTFSLDDVKIVKKALDVACSTLLGRTELNLMDLN